MFKQLFTLAGLMIFTIGTQAALVNNDPNNLVTNGSFTGTIANSSLPLGWNVATNNGEPINTPDTMDETANFGFVGTTDFAAPPSATPDGETWVGLARDGAVQNELISQTVSGFNIGTEYTISWFEGNFGYDVVDPNVDFLNANAIQVDIGGVYQFNGAFIPTDSDWVTRSFNFQATQNSYELSFGLINPARSYLSLEGVSVTAVAAIPEPATYAMLLSGGLLIAGFKRKQQS